MADLDLAKADDKNAKLSMKLRAKSGYSCATTYQVSANQWAAIIAICEQDKTPSSQDTDQ